MDLSKRLCIGAGIGAATLIALALVPERLGAQEEPVCPSVQDQLIHGEQLTSHSESIVDIEQDGLTVQPCEEVRLEIVMTSHPSYGASVTIQLLSDTGYPLWGQVFSPYGSGSGTVPASDAWYSYWFTHYPATRGTEGIPRKVRIYSNVFDVYSYDITVKRRPRPGYNLGGTGFSNAPLIPLGTEIKGNVDTTGGQFWKIHLDPGQKIWLTGEATGPNTDMTISLYDAGEQLINPWFVGMSPFVNTPFPTPYAEFVNGPQAADYYLRATTRWSPVWDFKFVVQTPPPPPQLKLFLEADDPLSFNIADPNNDDDSASYIPGSGLDPSESVDTMCGDGQLIQLVAAFVDATGQIVPPPVGVTQVEFQLEQTSAFTGCAMNYGTNGADPDFTLVGSPVVNFMGDVATIGVRARDFGGFTTARVVIPSTLETDAIHIPRDDGSNGAIPGDWLPDGGWHDYLGNVVPDSAPYSDVGYDVDPTPNGETSGDGLVAFEEYRGFVVDGVHRRTNPDRKDLFYRTDLNVHAGDMSQLCDQGDCVRVHGVLQAELNFYVEQRTPPPNWERRIINFNYMNGGAGGQVVGHTDQAVLEIVEGGYRQEIDSSTGQLVNVVGSTPFGNNPLSSPMSVIGAIQLYTLSIREVSPPTFNQTVPDNPTDFDKSLQTVGHELGHASGIPHWVFSAFPGRPPSVMMTTDYFTTPNAWSNIPHTYDDTDKSRFRLR